MFYDGHLQRTVVTVTVHPAHTVMLVRDSPSGFSIYTESKYNTTDLMTVRHSHDGQSCTTVMLDRDPVSKGLSFFPQVFPNGHM